MSEQIHISEPILLCDTREQAPLCFRHLRSSRATLDTGDYSLQSLTEEVCIERKSLPDLLNSLTHERARFLREIQRMLAYRLRLLLIVGTASELHLLLQRRRVTLESIAGSLSAIEARGVPVEVLASPEQAAERVESLALFAWREKWKGVAKIEVPSWARSYMKRKMGDERRVQ